MDLRSINDFTNTSENEISLCTAGIPVTSVVNYTSPLFRVHIISGTLRRRDAAIDLATHHQELV